MIRKERRTSVSYSVVELDGVRHAFVVAMPAQGIALLEQAKDVLQSIDAVLHEESLLHSTVMQSVFLKNIDDQIACRQIIEEFYGKDLPATTYVPEPPCDGSLLSIEAWAVGNGAQPVEIERAGDGTVIARHNNMLWAYVADVRPTTAAGSTYERSLSALHLTNDRLKEAGVRFDDVVRTWLYLGNITAPEGPTLRYHAVNQARSDFYQNLKFGAGLVPRDWDKPVFPASTGIGMEGDDVSIHCIALQTARPDVALFPLENPQQTSACNYSPQYGPQTPRFARAMAVATGESVTTFISGTASITGSDTRYVDDFERQTRQTLDNIELLISADNFRHHGLSGIGATLNDLALARVYLKRREDLAAARAICASRLGELPVTYVVGDICRPELLVEIEGIAFSGRHGH